MDADEMRCAGWIGWRLAKAVAALAACSNLAGCGQSDTQSEKIRQPELNVTQSATIPEAELIAAYPAHLRRDGERLEIRLPGLEPIVLTDRSCAVLEGGDCVHYRLDALFPATTDSRLPLFGVAETYYEGGSYLVVANDGSTIETGERPVASPDGRYLVSAASSDGHPPDTGLQLFRRMDQGQLQAVRVIPTGALTNFDRLRWLSSDCIGFLASVTDRWGAYGKQRDFRLVVSDPEWALTTEVAKCTVGRKTLAASS